MNLKRKNNNDDFVVMVRSLEGRMSSIPIDYKRAKFLITNRPTEDNLLKFIENLKTQNVKVLVRVCGATYALNNFRPNGIEVIDLPFRDGSPPPKFIINEWLKIIQKCFFESNDNRVAIHCFTGLGRGPVLVGVALMELGLSYNDAVNFIRSKLRGAINNKQLAFLETYRAKRRLKLKRNLLFSCFNLY